MAYFNPYYNYNYQQQNQTIQNGGFVTVRNEEDARAYPLAHGTSITFRDETSPYIYTKTLGFSQMDSPVFEKYRLIKETPQMPQNEPKMERTEDLPIYVTKAEFEALRDDVERLRKELGDE